MFSCFSSLVDTAEFSHTGPEKRNAHYLSHGMSLQTRIVVSLFSIEWYSQHMSLRKMA